MKRILVIVNKQWECDPIIAVLGEKRACPIAFAFEHGPYLATTPGFDRTKPNPRAVIRHERSGVGGRPIGDAAAGKSNEILAYTEVWCLEDWMPQTPPEMKSSSEQKMKVLPLLFAATVPDIVIAVGTAGFVGGVSENGSVVLGSRVFVHDATPGIIAETGKPNPYSKWQDPRCGQTLRAAFGWGDWRKVVDLDAIRVQAEARFLPPPLAPAEARTWQAAENYTAVGVANVTNYDHYIWADGDALAAFRAQDPRSPIGSVETTHGLIRIAAEDQRVQQGLAPMPPFMFLSAITDREGRFNAEVGERPYAQNFASSHNAGVALAWMLPSLAMIDPSS